jgi:hypothetical protein
LALSILEEVTAIPVATTGGCHTLKSLHFAGGYFNIRVTLCSTGGSQLPKLRLWLQERLPNSCMWAGSCLATAPVVPDHVSMARLITGQQLPVLYT